MAVSEAPPEPTMLTHTWEDGPVAGIARLVRARDADRGAILEHAYIFANPAASAEIGINARPFDDPLAPIAQGDLFRQRVNGLRRYRAVFLAHHALAAIGVRQTAHHVETCEPNPELFLLLERQGLDRLCRADLAAQVAVE